MNGIISQLACCFTDRFGNLTRSQAFMKDAIDAMTKSEGYDVVIVCTGTETLEVSSSRDLSLILDFDLTSFSVF